MTEAVDAATLAANLDNPTWRLSNLYKIIIKGDGGEEDLVVTFKPNRAQRRFIARMWNRNIILKARQLGFTTLVALLWLDTALFSKSPMRCGIIAQDKETAEIIFRDKVVFAYDNLPDELRERFPLKKRSASELVFGHNDSSIRVATSVRGGTIHRLHISEHGKICAKYPDKAREIVTGSFPAVPLSGITIIESTAEGQEGDFYDKTQAAMALAEKGAKLNERNYRLHFYAWWEADEYEMDPAGVIITEADLQYFAKVEAKIGRKLSDRKRAWYVATREADFGGDDAKMWQEYPSYPEEAFQLSTDGCWYSTQLAAARTSGRIVQTIPLEPVPVNTFWDIGRGDMTSVWFHQRVGLENRFIRYYENSGEDLQHYVVELQRHGYVFGRHYIPHDAAHRRMGMTPDTNLTIQEMLQKLMPGQTFEIVPAPTDLTAGIQATRSALASCWFDETNCFDGLKRLSNYRKEWDRQHGCWRNFPAHDDNSHGSDAFRQFGQEVARGNTFPNGGSSAATKTWRRNRNGSGMAA